MQIKEIISNPLYIVDSPDPDDFNLIEDYDNATESYSRQYIPLVSPRRSTPDFQTEHDPHTRSQEYAHNADNPDGRCSCARLLECFLEHTWELPSETVRRQAEYGSGHYEFANKQNLSRGGTAGRRSR
jgi:hypothetical protein